MNSKVISEIKIKGGKVLILVEGDITERNVDVIVNPANSYLQHGGGVASTIVRKGGSIIQEESDKIGFIQVGSSAITSSGILPCKAIIHTVGPRMGEGNEDAKLTKAINSCLELGLRKGFESISIPAISSGIFGFPKDRCAKILVNEATSFLKNLENSPTGIKLIEFCILGKDTLQAFQYEFEKLKPES
jgi:O-acetyl-ADP-ribose deacetylase